jgi:peptidoglycan-associated lipoprotein
MQFIPFKKVKFLTQQIIKGGLPLFLCWALACSSGEQTPSGDEAAAAPADASTTPPATDATKADAVPPTDSPTIPPPVAAVSPKPEDQPVALPAGDAPVGDSDSDKALGIKTIQFPYDSYQLDRAAKEALQANSDIMMKNAAIKVQIEGHCDQRGGIQYNLALGEKRANAVKSVLIKKYGIDGSRISIISYGKEHPLDSSTTDDAYAKNRRANFVIVAH